jgi:hypothetical protein
MYLQKNTLPQVFATDNRPCSIQPEVIQNASKSLPGFFGFVGAVAGSKNAKDCQTGQQWGLLIGMGIGWGIDLGIEHFSKPKPTTSKRRRKVSEWQ